MTLENSRWGELGEYLVRVALAGLLLALCTIAPAFLAVYVNPWLGLLAATGGFFLWVAVIPPFPGFWNGYMCILGLSPIAMTWFGTLMLCFLWLLGGGRMPT